MKYFKGKKLHAFYMESFEMHKKKEKKKKRKIKKVDENEKMMFPKRKLTKVIQKKMPSA